MAPRLGQATKLHVVGATAAAIGLGLVAQRELIEEQNLTSGLIIWAIAIACFILALWRAAVRPAGDEAESATTLLFSPLAEALLLLAIISVGIFFRTYRLSSIPGGLNHDAAQNGLYAIRSTPVIDLISEPYVANQGFGKETMFIHLIALFQSALGPNQLAIELAAVAIGVLTLGTFYLLMRRLFDTEVALVATFLLSVSGWHITFSKVGWRAILAPLFAALVFFFVWKALHERRARDFLLAGVAMGLSLYTYDAARIIPIAAAAFVLYELIKDPSLLKTHYAHLAALVVGFAVSFAPMGWYALHHWSEFTGRANSVWLGSQIEQAGSLEPLFANLKDAMLIFNYRANGADFFVREPLVDSPLSVFCTLGFALAILRLRERRYLLLLTLLILSLAVGIASVPNGNRAIVAVLPVVAFGAIFVVEVRRWLSRVFPGYQHVFTIGLLALLLYAGYATYESYLGPDRRTLAGLNPEATAVGDYAGALVDDYSLHFAGAAWPRDTITYLTYPREGDPFARNYTYTDAPEQLLLIAPSSDMATAFIVAAHNEGRLIAEMLEARFPAATQEEISYPGGLGQVANAVLVPPGGGEGADLTMFTSPDVLERDAERINNLDSIASALNEYRERAGSVPSTSGEIEVVCFYPTLSAICTQDGSLPPEHFVDPRGEPLEFGYWYASDGATFSLYASLEGIVPTHGSCSAPRPPLFNTPNLYCVHG